MKIAILRIIFASEQLIFNEQVVNFAHLIHLKIVWNACNAPNAWKMAFEGQ